jgi:DNA polymerase elongation subunit (family B)
LGKEWADELSPIGRIYEKINKEGKFGQPTKEYVIEGISCIDYYVMYKKFAMTPLESYKLDYIAEVELGENKVSYEGSLWDLARDDWDTYATYNLIDVELIVKLDDKLKYIDLLRFISYLGLSNMENAIKTLPVVNGAVAIQARNRGEKIPTFIRPIINDSIIGGYVSAPKSAFTETLVSFDANSLYPSVMISLNLSPETKIGRVEKIGDIYNIYHVSGRTFELTKENFAKFIKEEEAALTKAGFLFSQKKKGIMPEFLDFLYSKRKDMKSKMFELKKQLIKDRQSMSSKDKLELTQNIQKCNTFQHAYKITLNSTYGYCANVYAPLGDNDIGSSVTMTGQAAIKQSAEIFKQYLQAKIPSIPQDVLDNSCQYSDTDSVEGSTIICSNIGKFKIEELWQMYQDKSEKSATEHGHDVLEVSGLKVSSFNPDDKTHNLSKVRKIVRHRVSKRRFKIKSGDKSVIITEDHGLMVYRNDKFIRISPLDYKDGDKIIIETL